jgi:hypothetical protein
LLQADDWIKEVDLGSDPFGQDGLRAFQPSIVTPRLRAQHGRFTVGRITEKRGTMENIDANMSRRSNCGDYALDLILIRTDKCESILGELYRQGIHDGSLYPDIDGACRELRRQADKYANPRRK